MIIKNIILNIDFEAVASDIDAELYGYDKYRKGITGSIITVFAICLIVGTVIFFITRNSPIEDRIMQSMLPVMVIFGISSLILLPGSSYCGSMSQLGETALKSMLQYRKKYIEGNAYRVAFDYLDEMPYIEILIPHWDLIRNLTDKRSVVRLSTDRSKLYVTDIDDDTCREYNIHCYVPADIFTYTDVKMIVTKKELHFLQIENQSDVACVRTDSTISVKCNMSGSFAQ